MHTRPLESKTTATSHGARTRPALWALAGLITAALLTTGCKSPATHKRLLTKDQEAAVAANVLKAPPAISHPLSINFDNKITLLGYDMEGTPTKGAAFEVTLFYRVDQPIKGDWKIFFHYEIPDDPATPRPDGQRVTVDHDGIGGLYPVGQWKKGEIIRDKLKVNVPAGWRSGKTNVWVGFFDWGLLEKSGRDRRLPIHTQTPVRGQPPADRFLLMSVDTAEG